MLVDKDYFWKHLSNLKLEDTHAYYNNLLEADTTGYLHMKWIENATCYGLQNDPNAPIKTKQNNSKTKAEQKKLILDERL